MEVFNDLTKVKANDLTKNKAKDLTHHFRAISIEQPSCALLTNSGARVEVETFLVAFFSSFVLI